MTETIRKVNVIGHLHPDTDSICSAIAYAHLKNATGDTVYEARRAGVINRETAFVLDHFGFGEPELITTVSPQIKDTTVQHVEGIDRDLSLFAAWDLMREHEVGTLCVTDRDGAILGIITVRDIANANMDIFHSTILSDARTAYANVLSTLKGAMVVGDPRSRISRGSIRVGTTPEMMDGTVGPGDIILVTNRVETQRFAVDSDASCLIICNDAKVDEGVRQLAKQRGCAVITTPYDTYAAARLISMSIPVGFEMLPFERVIRFSVNTPVDEARKTIAKTRHRFFPVLDESGRYEGITSMASLLNVTRKHVVLVDHNERSQAVDGLEQAEIMEIIDHHRIGSIETSGPVYFRNVPVGCTATIIYGIYEERGVEIPADIAGLMLSAILSDTLAFRSPTCTPRDVRAGRRLAEISGVDIDTYADTMFDAGADLTGRTAEEVFHQDFKVFSRGNVRFGVGQGSFMTKASRRAAERLVGPWLRIGAETEELPMVFYMFTDVKSQTTDMMCYGAGAEATIERAFGVAARDGIAVLPGVVSRKKQVTPALMTTLQEMLEEQA